MPRLSLGLGAQTQIKVGAAAPSGIPVASTASVVIGNAGFPLNGTYTKKIPEQVLIGSAFNSSYLKTGVCYLGGGAGNNLLLSPGAQVWDDQIGAILNTPFGNWKIITAEFDIDGQYWVTAELENNPSIITGYIPDASWSPSSTLTITAA